MSTSSSDSESDSETTFFSIKSENELQPITSIGQTTNVANVIADNNVDDNRCDLPSANEITFYETCLDYATACCYSISIITITGCIIFVIFKINTL